jgi:hypothetical protein
MSVAERGVMKDEAAKVSVGSDDIVGLLCLAELIFRVS